MSESAKKFELLDKDQKSIFLDGLKSYLGYQEEINEVKRAQKDQVGVVAKKIKDISKKDVKKLFTYFKKKTSEIELRDDADLIESIKKTMDQ